MTRRGLLGGTFDPIHMGHLDVARAAQRALALDDLTLLPSGMPPHRRRTLASGADRLAMVRLAAAQESGMTVSDIELQGDGPSYTVATLDRVTAQGADPRTLFFITGADAFRDITLWKDYPAVLDRCHFVAVSRPGAPVAALRAHLPALTNRMVDATSPIPATPSIVLIDAPTAPVSSTEVRQRVADGKSIDGLVPPAVAAYIVKNRLYITPADERV